MHLLLVAQVPAVVQRQLLVVVMVAELVLLVMDMLDVGVMTVLEVMGVVFQFNL
jgi:hypothetical protein